MSIEIRTPELERRLREGIQSGRFKDMDDLLTKALEALTPSLGNRAGALDWAQCPAVESVPGRLGGAWVFRGTRMPVAAVFENLEILLQRQPPLRGHGNEPEERQERDGDGETHGRYTTIRAVMVVRYATSS